MNPLEEILKELGVSVGAFEWLLLTVLAYILFGFGGCVFDSTVMRFRDESGRFIKWEWVLIMGTIGDILLMSVLFDGMGGWDKFGSIIGLFISMGLTVFFGMLTHTDF